MSTRRKHSFTCHRKHRRHTSLEYHYRYSRVLCMNESE
nr:MAG TPA: hypothetical protein [Caudoviricetes sp.]DAY18491.1 MAG TPA: hypothetical protein [Caudoviricetes sp.]